MTRLRVLVDRERCAAVAMCRAIAPEAFVETADGQSEAAQREGAHLDAASREAILEAAANCPVGAISVVDADTGEPLAF